jgi:hypothetical protein
VTKLRSRTVFVAVRNWLIALNWPVVILIPAVPSFDLISGWASIAGLAVGAGALIQAWRASRAANRASVAAEEARDSILIRNLAEECESACRKIDDLGDLLAHDRLAEALRVAHELTSALSEMPNRMSAFLILDQRNTLLSLREQVRILEDRMGPLAGAKLTAEQKKRFTRVCRKGSVDLRENLGTIKARIDFGGVSGKP